MVMSLAMVAHDVATQRTVVFGVGHVATIEPRVGPDGRPVPRDFRVTFAEGVPGPRCGTNLGDTVLEVLGLLPVDDELGEIPEDLDAPVPEQHRVLADNLRDLADRLYGPVAAGRARTVPERQVSDRAA